MPAYWTLIVMIVVMLSGLSDMSRIRRLEAQNQELLSRLTMLERQRPLPARQDEALAGESEAEGDDEPA